MLSHTAPNFSVFSCFIIATSFSVDLGRDLDIVHPATNVLRNAEIQAARSFIAQVDVNSDNTPSQCPTWNSDIRRLLVFFPRPRL